MNIETIERLGDKYVEWAQRRSDTTRVVLFFTTLFLFLFVSSFIELYAQIKHDLDRLFPEE